MTIRASLWFRLASGGLFVFRALFRGNEASLNRLSPVSLLCLLGGLLTGCSQRSTPTSGTGAIVAARAPATTHAVQFTDVTEAAGIRFRHTSGRSGRLYLPETMGAGCAFLDYNRDGKLDLFLVNGSRLPGYSEKGPFYPALYRNDGSGHFTDVTRTAGLTLDCYGMGVAVADTDGDGFPDLYLTALGPNHLFHNNGNGTFTDVTQKAGVGDPRFSNSAAWFDYDRDGRLDLFVGDYCRWTPATNQVCPDSGGGKHMCGPTHYTGVPSTLYHNDGNGTFTDVTKRAGLYETAGKTLGVTVCDFDGDGWLDLALAKDMEPNLLYHNNGDGTFSEGGLVAGIAYGNEGKARAGMGIDTADTMNDGRESILIGNFSGQGLAQFQMDPGGSHFTDVADQTGLYGPSLLYLTFGLAFVDYDADGFKDIVTANGHVDEEVHRDSPVTFAEPLSAFHNMGNGQFAPVGESLGRAFQEKRVWRGLAVGDYDNDGDPDLLISACDGKPALLRNDGGNRNGWLEVKAIGAGKNREGIGTRVAIAANGTRQIGWIRSGSSYCSQHELTAFFGLGGAAQAEEVELRFPSGARQTLKGVKANQLIVVQEGKGLVAQGAPGSATVMPEHPAVKTAGKNGTKSASAD
jgi:enediyne biosynthesis protein E4